MIVTTQPDVAPRAGATLVLDAVDRWAELLPAATAVTAPDGVLTFSELSKEVRAIAGALREAGAGPGVPVGLGFGRSRRTVPALLAVWRTGATAVPLDDRHPEDRIGFVLADAEVRLLLGELPATVPAPGVRAVHCSAEPVDGVWTTPAPDDIAYLVYTSGTTGRPKGVEVGYQALGTFLGAIATLGLTPGGLGFNPLSPAFDGWLWCTLLYLVHGQGVAIADVAASGTADLAAAIEAVAPRTVCMSPSMYAACPDDLPSVDVLVVAGEACPPALVRRLSEGRRVLNVYGPTETTIAATWADSAAGDDVTTIGRAIPGYQVHVLDAAGEPVPAGGDGELCVGGPAVALGYRNLPELTAERFVGNPFGAGRLYRTGDHVRLRADGQLEFLGRVDDQVKIRGFRVELGEVERTAAAAEEVRAAAAFVLASGDALGLVVVPEPGVDPVACVEAATGRCQHLLPDYMMPVVVEPVSELPVTQHGKADRALLAERVAAGQGTGTSPMTERERLVCEVLSGVLPRPVYDVHANFFDAGGHSLLASRAVVALRRATGLRLSVKDLLTHPTPAELARKLDRVAGESGR